MINMRIYDFSAKRITGEEISLTDFKGKVLLIVNTASKCGFTPQYEGLEALYQKFKDQGLEILGFPCNQFREQDPESNEKIHEFCKLNYGVTFPLFEKVKVNGPDAHPLFTFLKKEAPYHGFDENHPLTARLGELLSNEYPEYLKDKEIRWNFTKFLLDRDGNIIDRFEPTTEPSALEKPISSLL